MAKSFACTVLLFTSVYAIDASDPYANANTPIQSGTPHAISFSPGPSLSFSTSEEDKVLSAGFGFKLTPEQGFRLEVSTQATGADYTELTQKWQLNNGSKARATYQYVNWKDAAEKDRKKGKVVDSIYKLLTGEKYYTLRKLARIDSVYRVFVYSDQDDAKDADLARRKDTLEWMRAISRYYKSNPYSFGSVWIFNVELSANRQDISYLGGGYREEKDTYYGYGSTLSIGYLSSSSAYLGGSVKVVRSVNPGKSAQLSMPYSSNDSLLFVTRSIRVKEPTTSNSYLVGLEVRKHFAYDNDAFGLQLNVDYSITDTVIKANVPVYFLKDKSQALTGGVDFGWDSNTKEVSFGLFVCKSFELFP